MTCHVCPNCGLSLDALEPFKLGKLFVDRGGSHIWWGERPVPLTTGERLLATTIARAEGIPVKRIALAEAVGHEGDRPENTVSVFLCRVNAKFRAIDPTFDMIEPVRGQGLRWKTEEAFA